MPQGMNIIIDLFALLVVGMLYLSGRGDTVKDYGQPIFDRLLICIAMITLIDLMAWLIDGMTFACSRPLQMLLNTLLWAEMIRCAFLWFQYARLWLWPDAKPVRLTDPRHAIPLACLMGALVVNLFTGWLFSIDASNVYIRGPLYLPLSLAVSGYCDVACVMTLRRFFVAKDQAEKRSALWMSCFMVFPYLGGLMQMVFYGVSIVVPFYTLDALMIYLNVHQQRMVAAKMKVMRQEADLQKANVSIMLSQIQPHFLYNALCVIQDLCNGKAPEAEQATIAFSRFLRGNLDSLKADRPISFRQELDHTRYYLTLEKMRFGERLQVIYDIRAELFRLPALTLQPIVENAVRYGVTKRPEGGTVRITTEETDACYSITVTDDGVGFDPLEKHEDGRTHIGISNVSQRLRAMCGGELRMESVPGQGTKATMLIPKGGDGHDDLCGG